MEDARKLNEHQKVPKSSNIQLDIEVVEAGAMPAIYDITRRADGASDHLQRVVFRHQSEDGQAVDGVTDEALLAVLIDRFRALRKADPCLHNTQYGDCLKTAMYHLNRRKRHRIDLGIHREAGVPTFEDAAARHHGRLAADAESQAEKARQAIEDEGAAEPGE